VVSASIQGVGMAVAGAGLALTEAMVDFDGRSFRRQSVRRFSIRQSQLGIADADAAFDNGWFFDQFRCSKSSFDSICKLIEEHWLSVNDGISHNAVYFYRERVAVTLHFLTHSGNVVSSAKMFGMSKSSANRFIWQVVEVIGRALKPIYIKLPQSASAWEETCQGFESVCGYPNGCLAIDGSLFKIERPDDFEGWYCRKLYPAINAQIVIDSKCRICSYDLRPGSANDQSIFNYSEFGKNIHNLIPAGKHVIADAGYALSPHIMIPFPITETMAPDERTFNYLHSRTRIAVERAIGMLKGRFRILRLPLNQKPNRQTGSTETTQMAKVIRACFVLHNIFCSFNEDPIDYEDDDESDDEGEEEGGPPQQGTGPLHDREHANNIRNSIKIYLFESRA
jgi:hypothetical protein